MLPSCHSILCAVVLQAYSYVCLHAYVHTGTCLYIYICKCVVGVHIQTHLHVFLPKEAAKLTQLRRQRVHTLPAASSAISGERRPGPPAIAAPPPHRSFCHGALCFDNPSLRVWGLGFFSLLSPLFLCPQSTRRRLDTVCSTIH